MEVDDTERQVLDALFADGRASVQDLSSATGIAPAVVRQRLDELESRDVITGYEPRIDYDALGLDLTAIVQLSAADAARDDVLDLLRRDERLTTVYEVSGEYDVFAVGKFADVAELNQRIGDLVTHEAVGEVTSAVVLDAVLERGRPALAGD